MAETDEPSQAPKEPVKQGGRPEALWPLAAVAATALLAVCGLALGLVLILGRGANAAGQSVQVNPVINVGGSPAGGGANAASAAAAATPAGPRRGEAQPSADQRDAAQDVRAVALPGVLATPTPPGGQRERQLVRAETQSPPSPPFPVEQPTAKPTAIPTPEGPRVYLRVRTVGGSAWDGAQALPMPIRASIDSTGKVAQVYAVHQAASATAQPLVPDVAYADTGAAQAGWDLQLSAVRKTGALDGYRAPAGFLFLTARMKAQNKGAQAVKLDEEKFEVRDADGVRYLCIPELDFNFPSAPVAAGATAELTLSFLVLDAADLRTVALLTDGAPVLLPLTRK